MLQRFMYFLKKTRTTIYEEGCYSFLLKVKNILLSVLHPLKESFPLRYERKDDNPDRLWDVLFINGCGSSVPHPARYRVEHQREQLQASGVFTASVFYADLKIEQVRHARNFIFFRCPYTDTVADFIVLAKSLNKCVYFDIDDLVIDTKYTDTVKYLDTLSEEARRVYDEGVKSMGKTLLACGSAITSTEQLAHELKKYVPKVFLNRNVASEEMWHYSEHTLFRRDVLPTLSFKQVKREDRKIYKKLKRSLSKREKEVIIGYFSGSITHNDDYLLILPVLLEVLALRPEVKLLVVGELDLPPELESYRDRVIFSPFVPWHELPALIARADINLVPLEDTLFNACKSENKWVEAALVKVVTVASAVGACEHSIEQGVTGVLCNTAEEWLDALIDLVDNKEKRMRIAEAAYCHCTQRCVSLYTGVPLASYIQENQTRNITFALPSLKTSGGVNVALKHATILKDNGWDVTILNSMNDNRQWVDFSGCRLPVINRGHILGEKRGVPLRARIDVGVATLWEMLSFFERYNNIDRICYLVQSFETDFFAPGNPCRPLANATYCRPVEYITISPWCQGWLADVFAKTARFANNGIEIKNFYPTERVFKEKRIRILIEGDSMSPMKNIDEAFVIANTLDRDKFEVWYMANQGKLKPFYQVDKFLGAVPHEEVSEVYRSCHILLKTSILESFSYPPLEMMATGGFVVALLNDGNKDYLQDHENCLIYERGNIDQAVEAIENICKDENLRATLYRGGQETANCYAWEKQISNICALYQ